MKLDALCEGAWRWAISPSVSFYVRAVATTPPRPYPPFD